MPCLERISLPQEINIHLYFLAVLSKQYHLMALWSSEENCRKSEQLVQWHDCLPSSIPTLLPFKKMSLLGKDRTRCHFVGLLEAAYHSNSGTLVPHVPQGFTSYLRGCLLESRWFLSCCWWEPWVYHLCALGRLSFFSRLLQRICLGKINT